MRKCVLCKTNRIEGRNASFLISKSHPLRLSFPICQMGWHKSEGLLQTTESTLVSSNRKWFIISWHDFWEQHWAAIQPGSRAVRRNVQSSHGLLCGGSIADVTHNLDQRHGRESRSFTPAAPEEPPPLHLQEEPILVCRAATVYYSFPTYKYRNHNTDPLLDVRRRSGVVLYLRHGFSEHMKDSCLLGPKAWALVSGHCGLKIVWFYLNLFKFSISRPCSIGVPPRRDQVCRALGT